MRYDSYELTVCFMESSDGVSYNQVEVKEQEDFNVREWHIYEMINQVPSASMVIDTSNPALFRNVKNISVKFTSVAEATQDLKNAVVEDSGTSVENYSSSKEDPLTYKTMLGVATITMSGNRIMFSGYLVPWEAFRIPKTRYLGENTLDALNQLKLRSHIYLDNKYTGAIHQINQSDMQQCLAICQAEASTPFWTITKSSINLIPVILHQKDMEDKNTMQSDNAIVLQTVIPLKENTEDSNNSWFQCGSIGRDVCISDYDKKDQLMNGVSNAKLASLGLSCQMMTSTPFLYTDIVGTQLENDYKDQFPEIEYWVVLAVYTHCLESNIHCEIQYGGVLK